MTALETPKVDRRLSLGRFGAAALVLGLLLAIFSVVIVETGQVGVVIRTGADALSQVANTSTSLRQQYPLVFDSYAGLVARTQQASGAQSKRIADQTTDTAAAPKTGEWRDRELMRSRDRVDRPGSGS